MQMTSSPEDPIKFVSKGWGYEKWLANSSLYCGKILWFARGKQCSWHYHNVKDEVFYVHSGKLMVYYGWKDSIDLADVTILQKGDKFHVPTGMRHRMYAMEDTEMFEFSTEHFDEDSIRIEPGD
jgi:mannose-6-phosphate isomerase-like protein (cupin superfamily)